VISLGRPARRFTTRERRPILVPMAKQAMELRLDVGLGSDAEASEVDEAILQLQRELLELDVAGVARPPGPEPPPGTRGAELPELATLLVTLGPEAIAGLAATLAAWVGRVGSRRVTLRMGDDSLEATGISKEDQRRLIESFLARQVPPAHERAT
jgi:hypothetical protein